MNALSVGGRTKVAGLLLAVSAIAGCDLGPGEPPALYGAVSEGDVAQVKRLLDEGSDPNQAHDGTRVLDEAAVAGSTEMVRALLAAGADPCSSDPRPSALARQADPQDPERRAVVTLLTEAERRC